MTDPFPIARTAGGVDILFSPAVANRHGLITGATGTGKTVSLQVLADHFSAIGVPVFLSDVKGDLSGLAAAGSLTPKMKERLAATGVPEPAWRANPVVLWDVFGKRGIPVRATISDLGPLILGRLLGINPTQQGVLTMSFKIADDAGLLLLDLKDLRAMLAFVGENAGEFRTKYGNVSMASIGAIQRALLELEQQGGDQFFGEPMLDVDDLLQTDSQGRGVVNILAAADLINPPEGVRRVPAVDPLRAVRAAAGDRRRRQAPAHLLLRRSAPALHRRAGRAGGENRAGRPADSIEGGRRLLRHAQPGRPARQRQVAARSPHPARAARLHAKGSESGEGSRGTLRPNPAIDMERAISELAVGEALVSLLDAKGTPAVTERAWIAPPSSQIGPIPDAERERLRSESARTFGHYDRPVDRESAYEKLTSRTAERADRADMPTVATPGKACRRTRAIGLLVRHLLRFDRPARRTA